MTIRLIFAALIANLHAHASSGPCSHLLIGLHDDDPLYAVAEKFAFTRYTTNLYSWYAGRTVKPRVRKSTRGPPYLELGSL